MPLGCGKGGSFLSICKKSLPDLQIFSFSFRWMGRFLRALPARPSKLPSRTDLWPLQSQIMTKDIQLNSSRQQHRYYMRNLATDHWKVIQGFLLFPTWNIFSQLAYVKMYVVSRVTEKVASVFLLAITVRSSSSIFCSKAGVEFELEPLKGCYIYKILFLIWSKKVRLPVFTYKSLLCRN